MKLREVCCCSDAAYTGSKRNTRSNSFRLRSGRSRPKAPSATHSKMMARSVRLLPPRENQCESHPRTTIRRLRMKHPRRNSRIIMAPAWPLPLGCLPLLLSSRTKGEQFGMYIANFRFSCSVLFSGLAFNPLPDRPLYSIAMSVVQLSVPVRSFLTCSTDAMSLSRTGSSD